MKFAKGKLCFGSPISQYYCFQNRSLHNPRYVHYFKKLYPFHALYTICNYISEITPHCIPVSNHPPLHVTETCAFNKHKNLKRKIYEICKTQRTPDPIYFEIWGNSVTSSHFALTWSAFFESLQWSQSWPISSSLFIKGGIFWRFLEPKWSFSSFWINRRWIFHLRIYLVVEKKFGSKVVLHCSRPCDLEYLGFFPK